MLDGARLVDVDVSALGGDHTVVGAQQRIEHDLVGLCAADEEEDLRLRAADGSADLLFGLLAVTVRAVARELLKIDLIQALQDFWVSALGIIVDKGQHISPSRFFIS